MNGKRHKLKWKAPGIESFCALPDLGLGKRRPNSNSLFLQLPLQIRIYPQLCFQQLIFCLVLREQERNAWDGNITLWNLKLPGRLERPPCKWLKKWRPTMVSLLTFCPWKPYLKTQTLRKVGEDKSLKRFKAATLCLPNSLVTILLQAKCLWKLGH